MLQSSKIFNAGGRILCYCIRTISSTQKTNAQPKRQQVDFESQKSQDKNNEKIEIKSTQDSDVEGNEIKAESTDKLDYYNALKKFDDLPAEAPSVDIGFWQTERGLQIKDQIFTVTGRVARLFCSKERYDNLHEAAILREKRFLEDFNKGDESTLKDHGPEWAMGQIIFQMGGAVKLRYDDRWVENVRCLRTPKRRDFRLEGIDLRKSAINHIGLKYLFGSQHVRYFNAGDAKSFDDQAMACLHPLADSLEFLDISGTSVTERGFGYMRLFHKLRFLNLSRLEKATNLESLIPYLLEILPEGCCVITNDDTPANMYGSQIPFRSPYNPKKDLPVMEGNKNIGDLVAYKNEMTELDFHRIETIHELWMTPVIGTVRKHRLIWQQGLDDNFTLKLVRYIIKANNYKPLL